MIGDDRGVPHRFFRTAAAAAVALVLAGAAAPMPSTPTGLAPQALTPADNPEIAESCGVDVTLVLDASGSVSQAGAVGDVSTAARTFLDALANTASTARVTQFATVSEQLAGRTLIDDVSLAGDGVLKTAVDAYYNPKPPRPASVTFREYRGGSLTSPSSFRTNNSLNQYTNWDQGLDDAGQGPSDLVVFITDGDPTAYDLNQPGDPFDPGPPPDVAVKTDSNPTVREATLDRAIEEANQIKAARTRILAVGVGGALSSTASRDRLVAISGPQVRSDVSGISSINEVDVALVTDFADLAGFLRSVVLELCSPSLTIRKLAQSEGDAEYVPTAGWDITVTPTVPGGTFAWILPDPGPGAVTPSKIVATNDQGFAQFQWEPDPAEADSRATVEEALVSGWIAGRPDDPALSPEETVDWRCELKDESGNVRVRSGEFTAGVTPSFLLDPIGQEIVTCTIWNAYDYRPAIALAKVNSPTELRGDLDPAAELTSSYTATNPGNTPLDNVTVGDDRCAPVVAVTGAGGRNVGDTAPADGRLDPGEQWQYTCDEPISTSASTNPAGQRIVNTATVRGVDPRGTVVTATATDDVHAFNPAISLVKQVNGAASVTVPAGSTVTYTFEVENTGNTPLDDIRLNDVSTPDSGCAPALTDDGDGDAILALGEQWVYECSVALAVDTANVAVVDGVPLNPVPDPDTAFPDPNPRVSATDRADVTVVDANLTLTKVVDQAVVFAGTTVDYRYEATNTGAADLVNPDPAGTPGWVTDDTCSPVAYVSGDTAPADGRLNPGETWTFSCPNWQIDAPTRNVAEIVAQPVDAGGTPVGPTLTRTADAYVDIVTPGIDLVKTALTPVVLDPDANPVGTATGSVAVYEYVATNPGTVPLQNVSLVDDKCAAVTLVSGDADGDSNLDVDEAWQYRCETSLQRQDGTPPPLGAESALVTNMAVVRGTPFIPATGVTTTEEEARATDQVLVIEPRLSLTKTASAAAVLPGTDVTYTFVVANLGDVGLRLVGPLDSKCAPLEYVSGDNGNGILEGANGMDGAESWTYECTRPIGMPAAPATDDPNRAAVVGIDPLGNLYVDTDTAVVKVVDPAIALVKSVSETLVPAGTSVTYQFAVTNAGVSPVPADDVLEQVTLVDAALPAQPACEDPVLVAKDGGNQDVLLDREPAETWRYECQATIVDDTVNLAVVDAIGGTPVGLSIPVFAVDAAFVQAFHPGLDVTKTASPTELLGGGDVTYTYVVRNTGDVPLGGVADRITDDTCSPVTYVSGDTDGDGLLDTPSSIFEDALDETWTFVCTTYVDQTTENTVTVVGTPTGPAGTALCPDGPCDVRGTDTETVTVTQPGSITVVKQVRGDEDGTFSFGGALGSFRLTTIDGSASRTFDGLAPATYRVEEGVPGGWQLAAVTCADPTGNSAIAASGATIVLDEGETVTCTFVNAPIPGIPPTAMRMLGSLLAPFGGPGDDVARLGLVGLAVVLAALAFVTHGARRRARRDAVETPEAT